MVHSTGTSLEKKKKNGEQTDIEQPTNGISHLFESRLPQTVQVINRPRFHSLNVQESGQSINPL